MLEDEEVPDTVGEGSTSTPTPFDLPQEVLQILPSDPFEQLEVARKITSIALSTRVSALESESSDLRASVAVKDRIISELQSQVESLEASLTDAVDKISRADGEKESLLRENASLTTTVKKLQRDVAKLDVFRKKLMQSLQEDEENPAGAPQQIIAKPTPSEDDSSLPPSRYSSVQTQASDAGDSVSNDQETDAPKPASSNSLLLASQTTTPQLTPPGSPPSLSASASPKTTSRPLSPRRHSMSFSTSRGVFDNRSSISISDAGSQMGRTRVDGKEFFRQVRTRLSYEQFGAFLANVKELNAHKQTRQETLLKAEEIFGADNKDLYLIFEGLITRNVH